MIKFCLNIGLISATLAVAACNAGPLLKTGSLTAKPTPAAPKPATSVDRALHVAATSIRAQRCGFYFDPAGLRTNFLAAEAARGTAGADLTKTGQSYDYTVKSIASKITNSEAYCTKERTASIKTSLQAALAGNFEPPVKKVVAQQGGLFDVFEADDVPKKFDPQRNL